MWLSNYFGDIYFDNVANLMLVKYIIVLSFGFIINIFGLINRIRFKILFHLQHAELITVLYTTPYTQLY